MPLGPLTRQALADAGIEERFLASIDDGTYEWTIRPASAFGISGDAELARQAAEAIVTRKDFAITIRRTEAAQRAVRPYDLSARSRRVYEAAIPNALGERIARTQRYEEALVARGEAESTLFQHGNVDDWIAVAPATSWNFSVTAFMAAIDRAAELLGTALLWIEIGLRLRADGINPES